MKKTVISDQPLRPHLILAPRPKSWRKFIWKKLVAFTLPPMYITLPPTYIQTNLKFIQIKVRVLVCKIHFKVFGILLGDSSFFKLCVTQRKAATAF